MKKQIWKFPINPNKIIVEMPKDAEILTIQTQNETPCIWDLVNPENAKELRHCEWDIERKYINTFQLDGGSLVFHLFERVD
jgi:hypothetical protein